MRKSIFLWINFVNSIWRALTVEVFVRYIDAHVVSSDCRQMHCKPIFVGSDQIDTDSKTNDDWFFKHHFSDFDSVENWGQSNWIIFTAVKMFWIKFDEVNNIPSLSEYISVGNLKSM